MLRWCIRLRFVPRSRTVLYFVLPILNFLFRYGPCTSLEHGEYLQGRSFGQDKRERGMVAKERVEHFMSDCSVVTFKFRSITPGDKSIKSLWRDVD